MSGNVWEWTQDLYDGNAYRSGAVTDPVNERSGASRAFRGGGWSDGPRYVRCSDRDGSEPGVRNGLLGFRLARTE
jgi:formylglycine-generating enzyme required for sulfatase activity